MRRLTAGGSLRIVLVLGHLSTLAAAVVSCIGRALGLDRIGHLGDDVLEKVERFVGVDRSLAAGVIHTDAIDEEGGVNDEDEMSVKLFESRSQGWERGNDAYTWYGVIFLAPRLRVSLTVSSTMLAMNSSSAFAVASESPKSIRCQYFVILRTSSQRNKSW